MSGILLGIALAGTWHLVRRANRMVERTPGPAGNYCRHHVGRPRAMVFPAEVYDYETEELS